jgi:hypothetical protein
MFLYETRKKNIIQRTLKITHDSTTIVKHFAYIIIFHQIVSSLDITRYIIFEIWIQNVRNITVVLVYEDTFCKDNMNKTFIFWRVRL